MTPEAQQIAIAEFCEWKRDKRGLGWLNPSGVYEDLPNYLSDLNAMTEAKACLNAPQRVAFVAELEMICEGAICFATAAEEAEAFIRAIRGTKPAK